MASKNRYRTFMLMFISFRDGFEYSNDAEFSDKELTAMTPEAYSKVNPDENQRPLHARSTTLEFIKKSIPHFVPSKSSNWDPMRKEGKPIRTLQVN